MTTTDIPTDALLRPGSTCWRKARATRAALIIDAADYFVHLRAALIRAERAVYLIGWDFDLRIEMMPGQSDAEGNAPDGWPNHLGAFLEAIVARQPEVRLHILKWDGAMIAELATQAWETLSLKMALGRIHFALDSHHPAGACHHQKIVVIDDRLAFCGGIDVTTGRWDTRDHTPDDERRVDPDGSLHQPWHDVTTALEGPVAGALGDLARTRWELATGEALPVPGGGNSSSWPDDLEPDPATPRSASPAPRPAITADLGQRDRGTQPRSDPRRPPHDLHREPVSRRRLSVRGDGGAAGRAGRTRDRDDQSAVGPELPGGRGHALGPLAHDRAPAGCGRARRRTLRDLAPRECGRHANLRPCQGFVVDDRFLKIGSSNIDNRSMGFDTESDVAIEASSDAERALIRNFTLSLLAEHLDHSAAEVSAAWEERASLLEAVEALRTPEGRSLYPIEPQPLDALERALADSRIFDPRQWPRNRIRPKDRAKHTGKRAAAPYHLEVAGLGTILVAVGIAALGVWAGRRMVRRSRRQPLAAPAIVTDRTFRPSAMREPRV